MNGSLSFMTTSSNNLKIVTITVEQNHYSGRIGNETVQFFPFTNF